MIIKDKFCWFCMKPSVVTSHLNRLDENIRYDPSSEPSRRDGTVQMRGHNVGFNEK